MSEAEKELHLSPALAEVPAMARKIAESLTFLIAHLDQIKIAAEKDIETLMGRGRTQTAFAGTALLTDNERDLAQFAGAIIFLMKNRTVSMLIHATQPFVDAQAALREHAITQRDKVQSAIVKD